MDVVSEGSEFVELVHGVIDDFRQGEGALLGLGRVIDYVADDGLSLFVEVVLPLFGEEDEFVVLLLPELDESVELEPADVLAVGGVDAHRYPLLGVDEAGDHCEEGVETVDFLEEGLRVEVVLVEEVGGEDVDEELVEVDSPQHQLLGEGLEVVVDVLPLLEQHPLEQQVPVVVRVQLLDYGAALAVQAQPLLDHVVQLLPLHRPQVHLNRDVLLHEVLQKASLRRPLQTQQRARLLRQALQIKRDGFALVEEVVFGEFLEGLPVGEVHLNGHQVFHGDVVVLRHAVLGEYELLIYNYL